MLGNWFLSRWPEAENRASFRQGFTDLLTPMVAIATWGFVTGIALVKSGLTENMATLMTLTVYAGSAQLTSLPLIQASAPLWLIFVAGFVVNIRFVIFGAALHPFFRHLSWPRRLVLGYLTSDIAFVLFMARFSSNTDRGSSRLVWYLLGIVVPGWVVWNVTSLLGIYMAALVPASWSLEYAAILALMAVVIPLVKTKPMTMCLIVAGVIAWVSQPLPLNLGLALAVIGGIVAGVVSEKHYHKKAVS